MTDRRLRDPAGNAGQYADMIESLVKRENALKGGLLKAPLDKRLLFHYRNFDFSERIIVHQYGAGAPLASIRDEVISRTELMINSAAFMKEHHEHPRSFHPYPLDETKRGSIGFSGIALLLAESDRYPDRFCQLVSPWIDRRSYLMDILNKAFIPNFSCAETYKKNKYSEVWSVPVLRALALPSSMHSEALADHMNEWCRIMRPFGWKPDLDTSPGKDDLFCDFAFEVALAVCAYDVDDSSFSNHPYYPSDLVQYYRSNVRHTRNAWRGRGIGADVEIIAALPPEKADLAKSKRKAFARWVELVCDGDIDATEAVLETIGKPRKVEDINELMESLADSSQAIEADIKDDEPTLLQAAQLAEQRALGDFDGRPGPPFGPARCSAGLLAFAHWLQPRGYRLVDLDNDDDAWHAVVVKTEYHAELLELSSSLKIRAREPDAVYND